MEEMTTELESLSDGLCGRLNIVLENGGNPGILARCRLYSLSSREVGIRYDIIKALAALKKRVKVLGRS